VRICGPSSPLSSGRLVLGAFADRVTGQTFVERGLPAAASCASAPDAAAIEVTTTNAAQGQYLNELLFVSSGLEMWPAVAGRLGLDSTKL